MHHNISIDELAALRVSHVTITVNAVDPAIGKEVYAYIRYGKRLLRPQEGVPILLENQLAAIRALKERDVLVKVNSIIIPGVNDEHIVSIARKVRELGADILNCLPYYPVEGTTFAHIGEPAKEVTRAIRKEAANYMPQMHHCTRCRADAVGLLSETPDPAMMAALSACASNTDTPRASRDDEDRPYVAVASMEGALVNRHLGETDHLLVYRMGDTGVEFVERRATPPQGGGDERWRTLGKTLSDCRALLVSGIGGKPSAILDDEGVAIHVIEGMIDEGVRAVFDGASTHRLARRKKPACGAECTGAGTGCG